MRSFSVRDDLAFEAHLLESLIDTHEKSTETTVETAVADSKYGSIENYLACRDRDIKAHFSSLEQPQKGTGTKKVFSLKKRLPTMMILTPLAVQLAKL